MDHGQIGHQVELLVHHRYQPGQLAAGSQVGQLPPIDAHVSPVRLDNAGQQV